MKKIALILVVEIIIIAAIIYCCKDIIPRSGEPANSNTSISETSSHGSSEQESEDDRTIILD